MTVTARRWAVVAAAGRGERFGGRTPKQYLDIDGRAVLSWSIRALLAERSICGVVVAIAAGDRRFGRLPEARDPRVRRCTGGARREQSVARALDSLAGEARDADWVLVHDAARPCLARADLRRLLTATRADAVGGLLAAPLADTVKRAAGGRVAATVDRDALWRALTPQVFRYGLLRRALALCLERGRPVTDEASAVEALGLAPLLVRGRGDNVKITGRDDLGVAGAILRGRPGSG